MSQIKSGGRVSVFCFVGVKLLKRPNQPRYCWAFYRNSENIWICLIQPHVVLMSMSRCVWVKTTGFFVSKYVMLLLLPFFHDCYFSINENDDASENDTKYWTKHWNKQNTIEAPENISVLNKIFDILKWK